MDKRSQQIPLQRIEITNKIRKRFSASFVIKKVQIKSTWDVITHLLEWLDFKDLTISFASKNMEQQNISFIAGENEKLKDSLEAANKAKYCLSIQSNNYVPRYLPNWFEKMIWTQMFIAFYP